ncbi:MAG: hypothetical protein R3D26_22675 [Cyanobacteriota/Melainabacteria group bacterium]
MDGSEQENKLDLELVRSKLAAIPSGDLPVSEMPTGAVFGVSIALLLVAVFVRDYLHLGIEFVALSFVVLVVGGFGYVALFYRADDSEAKALLQCADSAFQTDAILDNKTIRAAKMSETVILLALENKKVDYTTTLAVLRYPYNAGPELLDPPQADDVIYDRLYKVIRIKDVLVVAPPNKVGAGHLVLVVWRGYYIWCITDEKFSRERLLASEK